MQPSPTNGQRAAATIQLLASVAGSLLIVWGFLAKVAKPFIEWRRRKLVEIMRDVLRDELGKAQLFADLDSLIKLASDNHERLDEINDLLTAMGVGNDRRSGDRAKDAKEILRLLGERQARRRRGDLLQEPEREPDLVGGHDD